MENITTKIDSKVIDLNIINSTTNLSKDYIPIAEFKQELGISDGTLTKWRELGLTVIEVGRKIFINKKHLEKFMRKFEV